MIYNLSHVIHVSINKQMMLSNQVKGGAEIGLWTGVLISTKKADDDEWLIYIFIREI
jgi:hypothetical protein